jgi:hypothetical protein
MFVERQLCIMFKAVCRQEGLSYRHVFEAMMREWITSHAPLKVTLEMPDEP